MNLNHIPFGITDWAKIAAVKHAGERGYALWRTQQFDTIRVRIVEYSVDQPCTANKAVLYFCSWCLKGHILFCLEGELHTELEDGRTFTLTAGMSYQVADHAEAHRSSTTTGAKLFIVD